jgi:carbonic anhydrase
MNHGHSACDRRSFLTLAGTGIAGIALAADVAGSGAVASAAASPSMSASSPHEALAMLEAGNARFASGKPQCGPLTARIAELKSGQSPFAIVLGCSDSRVPIEGVFDQMPGDLFVIRIAGNYVTDDGLGSIEYSVAALKSKLIMVLGHSSCGAVTAAVNYVKEGTTQPGHMQAFVKAIAPAATAAKSSHGDWVANAIAENVRLNAQALKARSTIIADAVRSGQTQIVGARYDLNTGKVSILS